MLSLRRYVDSPFAGDLASLLRAVRLLIQGAGLHAIELDEADYRDYREDMERAAGELEADPTGEAPVVVAGRVNRAMAAYNQKQVKAVRMQQTYLHEMVNMLSGTVSDLAEAGKDSARQLHDVEREIEKAAHLEDFLRVRQSLTDSLKLIREEFQSRREESVKAVAQCRLQLRRQTGMEMAAIPPAALDPDNRTGLPPRREAEAAIREAIAGRRQAYLAIVALDRYAAISQRYGYEVADKVLVYLANHVANRLHPGDRFFSWSDAAVAVLLDRPHPFETVRRELTQALSERLETTVRANSREVLLPVHARWLLLPLFEGLSVEAIVTRASAPFGDAVGPV